MKKRQIINIIGFIRGCEPREPVDLVLPVKNQIRRMRETGLRIRDLHIFREDHPTPLRLRCVPATKRFTL